ncbi:hypothetical protein G7046_g950 [Stylonectria norvegica]|nr:hypothetical protein G7046_g950 [Stylonectria norvegica]
MCDYNVAIPVKLDAFVLNKDSGDGKLTGEDGKTHELAKIAPITQPNYTFLRIQDFVLQNDVLDHVDIHNASPRELNSRLTDLGTGELRENRMGVYLHWMVPRPYRSGAKAPKRASATGSKSQDHEEVAPVFRNPPTRWVVIRKIDPKAETTKPANTTIPEVEAWVVESDYRWTIDDEKLDEKYDLQVDVSPYIDATKKAPKKPEDIDPATQAEVFIGKKSPVKGWKETGEGDEMESRRVDLNLLNSSNQLFPDYQPHNGNVFSILDRFEYRDSMGNSKCLTDAVAHYYLLGWHWDEGEDPFHDDNKNREEVVSDLYLKLQNVDSFKDWLTAPAKSGAICHGAMYDVEWHDSYKDESPQRLENGNRPKNRPGDKFADDLMTKMPVSVGTTPIDALLAWVDTHHEGLADDLYSIRQLLRAQIDSVAGLQAASDELQTYNFSRLGGGLQYVLPTDSKQKMKTPDEDAQKDLRGLNHAQAYLDAVERSYQQKQWDTFSLWWKYVTDIDNQTKLSQGLGDIQAGSKFDYQKELDILRPIRELLKKLKESEPKDGVPELVADSKTRLAQRNLEPKSAVLPEFFQERDPSLFIAGAQSGWPVDYLKPLIVRLDPQIYGKDGSEVSNEVDDATYGILCLPDNLRDTARALINEFLINVPDVTAMSEKNIASTEKVPPLYHDQGDPEVKNPPESPWRDRWESTQPWFPLFLEWEAEYFHIEEDFWSFGKSVNRHNRAQRYMYNIPTEEPLWTKKDANKWERRTVSGRILILPQATFSLQAEIEQLFSSTPETVLDPILSKEKRDNLIAGIPAFPFLSASMDGFVNHLLTLCQGAHLKPNVRVSKPEGGSKIVPLVQAYELKNRTGTSMWKKDDIEAIGIESDLTPYGTLVQLPPRKEDEKLAFKPAARGQFRFTKINIIDKFGQCASAIDQTPRVEGPPAVYPCISDYYQPQAIRGMSIPELEDNNVYLPNVVWEPKDSSCQFMQMRPRINQPARINFSFVKRDEVQDTKSYWRPISEWENPIWGWLVINYVENGVQFFLPSGKFYREVRVAAPTAKPHGDKKPSWLPYERKKDLVGEDTRQLDALLRQFMDANHGNDYLRAFIQMVTNATSTTDIAPSAYGQFTNALVGKPLALANVGASLELASPPRINQSTIQLEKSGDKHETVLDETFAFKLGDMDRLHDGLVGYFRAMTNSTDLKKNTGEELLLDKVYTDHIKRPDPKKKEMEEDSSFFPLFPTDDDKKQLTPFFAEPEISRKSAPNSIADSVAAYAQERQEKLNANLFGVILDPFTPLHIFSGLLPVAALQLSSWTWEDALKKMTAFFHVGPLIMTNDVPKFVGKVLNDESDLKDDSTFAALGAVALPGLKAQDWAWLQPYVDEDGKADQFVALGIKNEDSGPQFERGPYTAIEGFLQMRAPIQQLPDDKNNE